MPPVSTKGTTRSPSRLYRALAVVLTLVYIVGFFMGLPGALYALLAAFIFTICAKDLRLARAIAHIIRALADFVEHS